MAIKQEGPRGFELKDAPETGAQPDAESRARPGREEAVPPDQLAPFTFPGLVLSLSTSALLHLGVAAPAEAGGEESTPELNLPAAKQVIDILEMLEIKTAGNLDEHEHELLERVLHDLRLRYVGAAKT